MEFDTGDLPAVASAIRKRFGEAEAQQYPTLTTYRFGGCSFLFQNEWDDPCLISISAEGDQILEALYMTVNADH
ncbi:hypothetical protein ACSBOB_24520 [Mesorhizobium sp. ASY16-5R]|uniref:hypothetical protein n=1 Tax=Mesorhizobium sp. ASY16-5R TaxID=3445772 RepID=UPI003FA02D50